MPNITPFALQVAASDPDTRREARNRSKDVADLHYQAHRYMLAPQSPLAAFSAVVLARAVTEAFRSVWA